MDQQEFEELVNGPEPDPSECRDVPEDGLRPGECDTRVGSGTGEPSLYCGAPRVDGYVVCRYHLHDAYANNYSIGELLA